MFFYIVMCWIFILKKNTADSQGVDTSIVSSDEIDEGEPFTVTCDVLRAGVSEEITTITNLYIAWSSEENTQLHYYAGYDLYISPHYTTIFSNATSSRNVTVIFPESLQETTEISRPNNMDTVKIEILFPSAICTDDGYYHCVAIYLDQYNIDRLAHNRQRIYIFSSAVDPWIFFITPQYQWRYGENNSFNSEGSDVSLVCGVDGPNQLDITWKFRNIKGEISIFWPNFYINRHSRWFDSEKSCNRYYHRSRISFQIEEKYDGWTFMCVATAYNRDTSIGNMTIHTRKTIVIPAVIEEGKNISLTCDAFLAGVPSNGTRVESLKISLSDDTRKNISIAEYWPNNSSYSIPHEMTLASFFTGSEADDGNNKQNSMYIEMKFLYAKCADAGVYTCQATYTYLADNTTKKVQQEQPVDNLVRVVPLSLKLNPQYNGGYDQNEATIPEGSNISITCNADGPFDLTLYWMINTTIEVKRVINVSELIAEPMLIKSLTTCVRYLHSSTLTFQTNYTFNGYMYVCVAKTNFEEKTVGNITIFVQKGNTSSTVAKNHERYDIVDPAVIVEGRPFTVTCDGSRAGVPENATIISSLSIDWKARINTPKTITYAVCRSSDEPQIMNEWVKREMKIYCNGTFNKTTKIPNRNIMQLKIIINDSSSEDAGMYYCNASYYDLQTLSTEVYNYQYVPKQTPEDYSFLYYAVSVSAASVLVVAVVVICCVKVRRDKARKRRFNLMTLPAIRGESFPPSMDSNGYLLPVDPNGGYAQISDTATYSENYYSSINELDFMNEGAVSDGQSEITTGRDDNQASGVNSLSDTETKTDLKFDNKMYKQLDAKSDEEVDRTVDKKLDVNMDGEIDIKTIGHVDRKTDGQLDKETDGQLEETKDDKLDVKSDGQVDRTVDDKLDVKSNGEIDFKTIGHLDRKTDGHLDRKTDGQFDKQTDVQLEKTKYVELDIKRNEDLDIKKDTEQKTGTNKPLDKDQQNESTPGDGLNDYAKLYDTPGNVFSPEVNTYVTLKF